MPPRSLLPLSLLLAALTGLSGPAAQGPAPTAREARYVDAGRSERSQRYAGISTAKLRGPARYRCRIVPEQNILEVCCRLEVASAGNLVLVIPAWNPGSYTIRNYGQHTKDLRVGEYPLERVQPGTWLVREVAEGPLELRYTMPATTFAERSFRRRPRGQDGQPQPRSQGAFSYQINGATLWIHEYSHVHLPCELELDVPESWDVATGMRGAEGTLHGFVRPGQWRFAEQDYDVFADCPLKLGVFESFGFELAGVPFEIALAGASPTLGDRQEFAGRVRRIADYYRQLFGELPFERYVFLFTVPGGGGLEHLNSTTIGLMSLAGSKPGHMSSGDSVIAHEFFHAWNVKRLRPVALGPFDYTGPNRSTALWFVEGVTSYYAGLGLVRTGLIEPADYWRHIARRFTALRGRDVRRKISVADSSWKVWDGRYWGAQDRIDYYLKGECLGFLLDIELRAATHNAHGFDAVLRHLYEQVERQGRGFAEEDIRRAFEHFAGRSLKDFFARYVYGTDDLPVVETLRRAGLNATWIARGRRMQLEISERAGAGARAKSVRAGLVTGATSGELSPR